MEDIAVKYCGCVIPWRSTSRMPAFVWCSCGHVYATPGNTFATSSSYMNTTGCSGTWLCCFPSTLLSHSVLSIPVPFIRLHRESFPFPSYPRQLLVKQTYLVWAKMAHEYVLCLPASSVPVLIYLTFSRRRLLHGKLARGTAHNGRHYLSRGPAGHTGVLSVCPVRHEHKQQEARLVELRPRTQRSAGLHLVNSIIYWF